MSLDRAFGGAQFEGDLLVQSAPCHQLKHLPFARRQSRHKVTQSAETTMPLALDREISNRPLDCRNQRVPFDRFGKKVSRTGLHGPHARGYISMTGEEDHR